MVDIMLDRDGDIVVSEIGDISLNESICQAVRIRLKWIKGEWRLGPDLGFGWFDEVFVKNPNLENIKQLIRREILQVDGVEEAEVVKIEYNPRERKVYFACTFRVSGETYAEEGTINA